MIAGKSAAQLLSPVGAKLVVAKWGVEAGFGGPVRSLRPLLWAYAPLSPVPKDPAEVLIQS